MGKPSVSIRLATEGKAQVRDDFAEIAQAGDATTKRLIANYDEQAAAAERAADRAARTAEKIAAIAPQTPMQMQVNTVTGSGFGGDYEGSARRSATAMRELIAEQETMEQRARSIRAAIDPLWAAQERYNMALAEARAVQASGAISAEQLAQREAQLKLELDDNVRALGRHGAAVGNSRIAQMELMHVVRGSIDQYAAGAQPLQIMTMHLGMLAQTAQMAGDGMGKFGAFMASGLGLGITAVVVVLATLISKLAEEKDAVAKATDELKKHHKEAEATREANEHWKTTLEGLVDASRKLEEQTKHLNESSREAAQRAFDEAKAQLLLTIQTRDATRATLEHAKAIAQRNLAKLQDPDNTTALSEASSAQALVDSLTTQLAEANAAVGRDWKSLAELGIARAKLDAEGATDAERKANLDYADSVDRIEASYRKTKRTAADYAAMVKALTKAEQDHAAALAAARGTGERSAEADATNLAYMQRALKQWLPGVRISPNEQHSKYVKGTHRISDHYYDRAIDFVPPGGVGSMTKDQVREMLESHGVRIRRNAAGVEQLFGPGDKGHSDHFHFAWEGGAPSPNAGLAHAESLRRDAEAMEASTRGALALADAYLKSGEAAAKAEAERKGETDATRKGIDVDAQVRRQLNLEIAQGAAEGAKSVAGMRDETAARASINDQVSRGAIAVADMSQAMSDEAALRPLLKLQALAQGDAYATLTRVIEAYRNSLHDAHNEEARSDALAGIDAAVKRVEDLRRLLPLLGDPAARSMEEARIAAEREADVGHYTDQPGDPQRTNFINAKTDEAAAEMGFRRAEYIANQRREQEDSLALAQRELELVGANDNYRQAEIDKLQTILELKHEGIDLDSAEAQARLANAAALDQLHAELERERAAMDELRKLGDDFVDTVFHPDGSHIKNLLKELEEDLLRLALINPFKNWLMGENNPTISSLFSALGKGGSGEGGGLAGLLSGLFGGGGGGYSVGGIGEGDLGFFPGFALGTENFAGGLAMVGEHGPEIAELPRGTRIRPAADTRRILGANDNNRPVIHYHDFRGAIVTEDIFREMELRAARAVDKAAPQIVGLSVQAVQEAYDRRWLRF